jgi:hypothetical protein
MDVIVKELWGLGLRDKFVIDIQMLTEHIEKFMKKPES